MEIMHSVRICTKVLLVSNLWKRESRSFRLKEKVPGEMGFETQLVASDVEIAAQNRARVVGAASS